MVRGCGQYNNNNNILHYIRRTFNDDDIFIVHDIKYLTECPFIMSRDLEISNLSFCVLHTTLGDGDFRLTEVRML